MKTQTRLLFFVPLILLAYAARIYGLDSYSIWFDEAFSWQVTQFGWHEMLTRLIKDVHPPLYYLALKLWQIGFGSSTASLRAHSLFWFALGTLGAFGLARHVTSKWLGDADRANLSGLIAVSLLSTNELLFRYSLEARMYSMAFCFLFWSLYFLIRALEDAESLRRFWLPFALTSAGLALLHNFGLFAAAAEHISLLTVCTLAKRKTREFPMRYAIFSATLAATLYTPWLPVVIEQTRRVKADYWAINIAYLSPLQAQMWKITVYKLLFAGAGYVAAVGGSHEQTSQIGFLLFFALPIAFWFLKRAEFRAIAFVFLFPIALGVAVCYYTGRNLLHFRYFMFQSCLFFTGLAIFLSRINRPLLRAFAYGTVLSTQLFFSYTFFSYLIRPENRTFQRMAGDLRREVRAGEPIVALHFSNFFPLKFHSNSQLHLFQYKTDQPFAHYDGAPIFTPSDWIGAQDLLTPSRTEFWTVGTQEDQDGHPELFHGWKIDEQLSFPEVLEWRGVVLATKWVRDLTPRPSRRASYIPAPHRHRSI